MRSVSFYHGAYMASISTPPTLACLEDSCKEESLTARDESAAVALLGKGGAAATLLLIFMGKYNSRAPPFDHRLLC